MTVRRIRRSRRLEPTLLFSAVILFAACGSPAVLESPSKLASLEATEPEKVESGPSAPSSVPVSDAQNESREEDPGATQPQGPAGTPLRPTAFADELRKLKLDPLSLPRLDQLSSVQKYELMPLFEQSLGKQCEDCHVGEEYEKETPAKAVARRMWTEMTRPFHLAEGPVFCDSCHQGSARNLARDADVAAYMEAEYAGRLLGADGKTTCAKCHGDEFDPEIFESVWSH